MAMLSRCAGFVRRWADGTFGVIHDRGRSDKPGQSVRRDWRRNGAHRA